MKDIFDKLDLLAKEQVSRLLNNRHKDNDTNLDILSDLFINRDVFIEAELIPLVKSKLAEARFKQNIIQAYHSNLSKNIANAQYKMQITGDKKISSKIIQDLQQNISKIQSIDDFTKMCQEFIDNTDMSRIYYNWYETIHGELDKDYIQKNYFYIRATKELYDYNELLKSLKTNLNNNKNEIIYEYSKINLDILHDDIQFSKYSLLSYNSHIDIIVSHEQSYLFDKRIDDKYFIIGTPRLLLRCFQDAIKQNYIKNISFKIDAIREYLIALEELDYGSLFSLNMSSLPNFSRLYDSGDYHDDLWIRHNKEERSLTFEELCSDFEVHEDKESVITQVVHLEYRNISNNKWIIEHLDHEYILYSFDEYTKRTKSHQIRGYKKVKTFKIDNGQIPHDYIYEGKYFLFLVLDSFLKNKELIREYFAAIQN